MTKGVLLDRGVSAESSNPGASFVFDILTWSSKARGEKVDDDDTDAWTPRVFIQILWCKPNSAEFHKPTHEFDWFLELVFIAKVLRADRVTSNKLSFKARLRNG